MHITKQLESLKIYEGAFFIYCQKKLRQWRIYTDKLRMNIPPPRPIFAGSLESANWSIPAGVHTQRRAWGCMCNGVCVGVTPIN